MSGVLSKKYTKCDDLFISLIQVLALKHNKEDRGVGMQRMKYAAQLTLWNSLISSSDIVTVRERMKS